MTEIKIDGGKYVLGVNGDGGLFCLRNGALWLSDADFPKGSKMLIALVHEHEDLANQLRDERMRHAAEVARLKAHPLLAITPEMALRFYSHETEQGAWRAVLDVVNDYARQVHRAHAAGMPKDIPYGGMSPEDREAQRQSFAAGNVAIDRAEREARERASATGGQRRMLADSVSESTCEHNVVPMNAEWGRCTKCGDETFPMSDPFSQSGDVCKLCGAAEVAANTPATKYACGSFDYDQRPGTFFDACSEEGKAKLAHLSELASKVDFSAFSTDTQGRPLTRVEIRIGRPMVGAPFKTDVSMGVSIPDYVFDGDADVTREAADAQTERILEMMLGVIRSPGVDMNDEVI